MDASLKLANQKLGSLSCRVVDSPGSVEQPRKLVVLCHGFGAPGDDLVPCAREIYQARASSLDGARFVFPAAPLELDAEWGDSRAWWPIDMQVLQEAMMTGRLRDLRNEQPPLLSQRRDELMQLIDELKQETGLDESQLFLGGFSQGAMLATDVALHLDSPPAGLIIWSGTLLNEANWRKLVTGRSADRRFSIVQTHGRLDPLLPFSGAEDLRDMLVQAGFEVTFREFAGPHTIPPDGIRLAADLIAG